MISNYGHVAPLRVAIEGTAALASRQREESDGDGNAPLRKKNARFAENSEPDLPRRLPEVTYDELVDLRNTALALALAKKAEKKKNDAVPTASRRRRQTPSSASLPDPMQLRALVLDALASNESLSRRESIDELSLTIARQTCWSDAKKDKHKESREAALEAASKVFDRRKKGFRRHEVEAARAAGIGFPAAPSADAVALNEDGKDVDDDDAEETATLVASVQLAVKQFLVGEAKKRKREANATSSVSVVGISADASASYLDASDDDCLLFSAAEELRMPFRGGTAGGEGSGRPKRNQKTALEGRGERAARVLPAARALAEALANSIAVEQPPPP